MKKLFSISIIVLFLFSLVSVYAVPPVWQSPIPDQTITANSGSIVFDADLTALPGGMAINPEGDVALTFAIQTENVAQVNCNILGNQLSGTPATGFTGQASCTVRASDNEGFSDDTFSITVNPPQVPDTLEVTGTALSGNSLVISSPKDYDDEMVLTFRNTGLSTLTFPTNAVTTVGTFTDEDGDPIQITFSNVPTTLAPAGSTGDRQLVVLSYTVDKDVDADSYPTNNDGKLRIATTQFTKEINLAVDVAPEDVCEDGRRADGDQIASNDNGNLQLTDFDVDPDDDFGPGELIDITNVEVSNDGDDDIDDVIVEAILYNINQDEIIARAESDSENVDSDDSVDFNDFELEVPADSRDLDEDDNYVMYLVAREDGNEDENCNYDQIDGMEFQRENNDVVITKATVSPTSLTCNANANFVVDVRNVGSDDDDRVAVQLRDSTLGLDWESELFSLDQFDDNNDAATVTYTYRVPSNTASGSYNVEAIVVFDGGRQTDSEFVTLQVQCGGTSTGEGNGNVRVSLVQNTVTASAGKLFGLPFKLANLEDSVQTYTVSLEVNGNWATAPQDEQVTLQPGQETTLYAYLTPNSNLNSGSYTADISVEQNGNVVATQTATVQISGEDDESVTGGSTFEPTVSLGSVWRNLAGSSAFWIVLVIVLFVIVVYVLTILLRPR